jgi:hypothetical protein
MLRWGYPPVLTDDALEEVVPEKVGDEAKKTALESRVGRSVEAR